MKFITIFSLLLVALLGYTSAQRCVGTPKNPSCSGARDLGRHGLGCNSRFMWYYDTCLKQCRLMRYLGCGGNDNRWCNRSECEQKCRVQEKN